MIVPISVSAVCTALFAISTYLPFLKHYQLHFPQDDRARKTSLNSNSCERVHAPGLTFCDDAFIHQPSGMAYITCDPLRLWSDPIRGVWKTPSRDAYKLVGGATNASAHLAGIWAWDLRQEGSKPYKLALNGFPVTGGLHPMGIVAANADPTNLNETDPSSLILLVTNQAHPRHPTVVDVLLHDLHKDGGRESKVAHHHMRLRSDHFRTERRPKTEPLSPYRLTLFHEQHSPEIPNEHTSARRTVKLPSFFFSTLPQQRKHPGLSSSAIDNYLRFVKYTLLPWKFATPPKTLFLYLARAAKSVTSLSPLSVWPGFVPQVKAWDGGGEKAGYNSSAAIIYTLDSSAEDSSLHVWDQHWVRGISAGIEEELDPYARLLNERSGLTFQDEPAQKPAERYIRNYHPSFLNFWTQHLRYPSTALDIDDWGRAWTGGSPDTRKVDTWINFLRDSLSKGMLPHEAPQAHEAIRPATLIDQSTYVWRQAGTTAHPWEMERMKLIRDRGVMIPKEFISTTVFRQAESPATAMWSPISISEDGKRQYGFIPTLPTGLAVDRASQTLLITGAYEERGIARCTIPAKWAEQ